MNNICEINLHSCDYCSHQYLSTEGFCPQCGIPNRSLQEKKEEDSFICPICESKKPIGERKCNYCCSLF